ncbi:MAG TPA: acyl-CoA thioesterase [Burkholderiaceae bacterium]
MRKARAESRWSAEVEIAVQFYDMDPMEIVWHGNYAKYLEVARCALLDRIDYNYPQMKQSGFGWPIVDMHLRYVAPARFGQKLRVRADLVEWENCLKIDYLITDAESGARINRASTTQVAVAMDTGEMCYCSPLVLLEKLGVTV